MSKNRKIEVNGIAITISEKNETDFISLTDIANGCEGGLALIEKWIRNKNTLEFLAIWERLYNSDFNSLEFEGIKSEAGTNRFTMSAKQWIQKTNAIGIIASAGRYGGTYAHKDIAMEFCSWVSPEFKLLLIREFQRLKEKESREQNLEWNIQRFLAKVNYQIQTDSIKNNLLPSLQIPKNAEYLVYASEADIINIALFGTTAKEWREQNPIEAKKGLNIRDFANLHQLTVLSNLESYNAIMIRKGFSKEERLAELRLTTIEQLAVLEAMSKYTIDKFKNNY